MLKDLMPINARNRAVKIIENILSVWDGNWFDQSDLEHYIQKYGGITKPTYLNYIKFLKTQKWLIKKDFKFKINKEKFERETR